MKVRSVLLLLLLAGLLGAAPQGYRLRRSPKVGEEFRYQLTAEIDVLGDITTITAIVIETIKQVEDGKYTVESVQTKASAKSGSLERQLPDSERSSAVYLNSGEPVSIAKGNELGIQGRLARMNAIVVPDKDIKLGDKWSHSYVGSTFSGGVGGKADFKTLSVEKVGERQAVVIQIDYKESAKTKPATSTGKAWIDADTGALLKLETSWKNSAMFSADAPMDATIKLERIG